VTLKKLPKPSSGRNWLCRYFNLRKAKTIRARAGDKPTAKPWAKGASVFGIRRALRRDHDCGYESLRRCEVEDKGYEPARGMYNAVIRTIFAHCFLNCRS
jgi:hypothetical protein